MKKSTILNVVIILFISTVGMLWAHGYMSKATIGSLVVRFASTFKGNLTTGGSIISDTDGTDPIGSAAIRYKAGYFDEVFWNKGADVASIATSMTLGSDGNYFDITGTTTLDSIVAQAVGKFVLLQFDAILTMTDGGNLKLIGDFITAAGATILLQTDGTDWYEGGRAGGSFVQLGIMEFGVDGTALDVTWYSDTPGDVMLWDTSDEKLVITGTNAQNALEVPDGNVSFTDDLDVDGVSNFDVTDIDGAVDMATTLVVTGVTTLTGGVIFATNSPFNWCQGGPVALATAGTDQALTDGPRQWVAIQIPYNIPALAGIGYLVGSTGGTDSVVVELFNSAGTLVATSIANATDDPAALVGTSANFQNVDFSSTYSAVAGTYYISVQFNGTTAKVRTYPIPGSKFVANTAGGTFRTAASITPGTTFVADEGPISYVY